MELCSQEELLNIFPKLYKDLRNENLETRNEYLVTYNHVTVNPPSDIENQLLELMCKDADAALLRQSGREYGFADEEDKSPRATQLHLLTKEELAGLPSNNIPAERHLTVFGRRAPVVKFSKQEIHSKSDS